MDRNNRFLGVRDYTPFSGELRLREDRGGSRFLRPGRWIGDVSEADVPVE